MKDRFTITTSANGFSVTSQYDSNGDGVVDKTKTDVTVLNADGSKAETITESNSSGGLIDKAIITTSANGLSKTTQEDVTGSGSIGLIALADGCPTEHQFRELRLLLGRSQYLDPRRISLAPLVMPTGPIFPATLS